MAERNSLGVVELSSISRGYLVQDAILKSSNAEKLIARTICSGKYFIAVRGDVADIENAISIAKEIGSFAIVNTTVIPNVDPSIFPAIAGATVLESADGQLRVGAILIIETFSVVSAIRAADFAIKEADVELLRVHVAMAVGGKGFAILTGEISALEAAARPAIEFCKQDGMLADYIIIKNPHEDVLKELL